MIKAKVNIFAKVVSEVEVEEKKASFKIETQETNPKVLRVIVTGSAGASKMSGLTTGHTVIVSGTLKLSPAPLIFASNVIAVELLDSAYKVKNEIVVLGNAGRAADAKYSDSGEHKVAWFSVAVNHTKDKDDKPDWYSITAFDKTADLCQELIEKGSRVMVFGDLEYNVWEGGEGFKIILKDFQVI